MPDVNGVELAKRITQLSPNTKIVLMSGYAPADIKRLIGKDGPEHRSMWKPFSVKELLHMLSNVLEDAAPGPGERSLLRD